jgi:hypothetical protein
MGRERWASSEEEKGYSLKQARGGKKGMSPGRIAVRGFLLFLLINHLKLDSILF